MKIKPKGRVKKIKAWAVVCECCGKLDWITHGVFGKTTARIYRKKSDAYNGTLEDSIVPCEIVLTPPTLVRGGKQNECKM